MLVRLRARAFGGVDRRAGRGRCRSHPRPSCGRSARDPERRRATAAARRAARAGRSPGRSRSPVPALPAAGPCPCPSARARATSCRGRCDRRCRPSAASGLDEAVLDLRRSRKPAPSSSARQSGSVRSRPPWRTSMRRSSHFAPCGSFPGGTTASSTSKRASRRRRCADDAQNCVGMLVVPVVEDLG